MYLIYAIDLMIRSERTETFKPKAYHHAVKDKQLTQQVGRKDPQGNLIPVIVYGPLPGPQLDPDKSVIDKAREKLSGPADNYETIFLGPNQIYIEHDEEHRKPDKPQCHEVTDNCI